MKASGLAGPVKNSECVREESKYLSVAEPAMITCKLDLTNKGLLPGEQFEY